jgi:hypothetical protein
MEIKFGQRVFSAETLVRIQLMGQIYARSCETLPIGRRSVSCGQRVGNQAHISILMMSEMIVKVELLRILATLSVLEISSRKLGRGTF